ncbi:MAG: prepilin peptidase [Patescibacteria group bacterium]|jgi:prepilin signal peptidase PulO-like enzyme (type II secretory pathway)|nr:prepilin peptidase [Patescibacteria group bacterium]
MFLLILLSLFVFGLCLGSFINAQQYRIEVGKKNTGRSFCPKCKQKLVWYDLIPVFSWVFLHGKCRYCRKPISWHYPLVELLTGFIFVGVGLKSGFIVKIADYFAYNTTTNRGLIILLVSFICLLLISVCFILIALHDAKTGYVLSAIVYLTIILSLVYLIVSYSGNLNINSLWLYFKPYLLSTIIAGGMFYLIYFISKGKWMGAGDIEIAVMMGIFLGWPNVSISLYFAFITGAIYGSIKVLDHKAGLKSAIPFGPFLIAGIFFSYFFGVQVFSTYARIFLGL